MKKSVVFPIMLAMGGVILSQMLAGCGGNNQMPKKEAENFKGGPMPEEWKNWKPGMPMPVRQRVVQQQQHPNQQLRGSLSN
jgi:hypothetical protein